MNDSTRHILYKIDRTLGLVFGIVSVTTLVLLVLAAFYPACKIAFFITWAAWGLILIARLCLSPFVKSEAEEEFEQQVEYILSHRSCESKPAVELGDYTPLVNLSDEQQQQVIEYLRHLPENTNKPGAINLALVAHYLTALQKMGLADLTDKSRLRLWVAQTTGKEVPSTSQFNEAVPGKANAKIAAAKAELEHLLHLA